MAEVQFHVMNYEPYHTDPREKTEHYVQCRQCGKTDQWINMKYHWNTTRSHDTTAVPPQFRYYKMTDVQDEDSAPVKIPIVGWRPLQSATKMQHKTSRTFDQYYADLLTGGYLQTLTNDKTRIIPLELQRIIMLYLDWHFILLRPYVSERVSADNQQVYGMNGEEMQTKSLRWLCERLSGDDKEVSVRLWFKFPVLRVLYIHDWLCTPQNV